MFELMAHCLQTFATYTDLVTALWIVNWLRKGYW